MNWTVHGHKCLSSFLFFRFFKLREREREGGIYNLGIKEKKSQSYLSYFSTGFHWRIFLLSRANRLYAIFLHWLEEPGVPRVQDMFLSSSPGVNGYGSVCHEPLPITKISSRFFRRRLEVPTSVLGSQPIIWLLPPPPWCPATWGY